MPGSPQARFTLGTWVGFEPGVPYGDFRASAPSIATAWAWAEAVRRSESDSVPRCDPSRKPCPAASGASERSTFPLASSRPCPLLAFDRSFLVQELDHPDASPPGQQEARTLNLAQLVVVADECGVGEEHGTFLRRVGKPLGPADDPFPGLEVDDDPAAVLVESRLPDGCMSRLLGHAETSQQRERLIEVVEPSKAHSGQDGETEQRREGGPVRAQDVDAVPTYSPCPRSSSRPSRRR